MPADVLRVLTSKNRCLERFLNISVEFWEQTEAGDFSRLEHFHGHREAILRGYALFDRKLNEILALMRDGQENNELAEKIEAGLLTKETLIHQILLTDERIAKNIEAERLRLSKELQQSQKSATLMKKFKSNWMAPGGEEIDQSL